MRRNRKKTVETPIYTFQPVLEEDLWAQCDHESCQKWRRLPKGAVVDNESKWYCEMNPDKTRNKCSVPEEEWPEIQQGFQAIFDPKLVAEFNNATLLNSKKTNKSNRSLKKAAKLESNSKKKEQSNRKAAKTSSQKQKVSNEDQTLEESVTESKHTLPKVKRQKVSTEQEINADQERKQNNSKSTEEEEKLISEFFVLVAKCRNPMELWAWNGFAESLEVLYVYDKELTQQIANSLQQWQTNASIQQVGAQVEKSCILFKQLCTAVVTTFMESILKKRGVTLNNSSIQTSVKKQTSQLTLENGLDVPQKLESKDEKEDDESRSSKRLKLDQNGSRPLIISGSCPPQLLPIKPPSLLESGYRPQTPTAFGQPSAYQSPFRPSSSTSPQIPQQQQASPQLPGHFQPPCTQSLQPQIQNILNMYHANSNNHKHHDNESMDVSKQQQVSKPLNAMQILTRGWGQPLPQVPLLPQRSQSQQKQQEQKQQQQLQQQSPYQHQRQNPQSHHQLHHQSLHSDLLGGTNMYRRLSGQDYQSGISNTNNMYNLQHQYQQQTPSWNLFGGGGGGGGSLPPSLQQGAQSTLKSNLSTGLFNSGIQPQLFPSHLQQSSQHDFQSLLSSMPSPTQALQELISRFSARGESSQQQQQQQQQQQNMQKDE